MREDEPCKTKSAIDLVSAVEEFHKLGSRELSRLICEAENGTIRYTKDNGSLLEINMESLARNLALHLISKLLSFKRDEQHLKYLLAGLRLLHSLGNLAPRHSKLEKVLFEDLNSLDQILDLVFFIIIFLGNFNKQTLSAPILLSSLLASSLYLLKIFIISEWKELINLILAHPKGDVFTTAAFPAVCVVIGSLQMKLSDTRIMSDVDELNRICLDCEASLQFLHSLCKQKSFREGIFRNKELCAEGGVFLLVGEIMKLPQCEDSNLNAAVSRLKSKILCIMLQLCEVQIEGISFLDMAASTTHGLDIAKSTVSEVLKMLQIMLCGDVEGVSAYKPKGILQLNALRVTDIFSDDSNFQTYIMSNFTEVLTRVFLLPYGKFLSIWCSSNSEPTEEDGSLHYDSMSASGHVLDVMSASRGSKSYFSTPGASEVPFSHQKTSLLVKIVASLTCYDPDNCKEERGVFSNKFFQCLQEKPSDFQHGVEHCGSERTAAATRNLRSLLVHARSLTPGFLHKKDLYLLRLFSMQLEKLITPKENNFNHVKEIDNKGKRSSAGPERSSSPDGSGERGVDESERDGNNKIETIGSYLSDMQSKNVPEEETVKSEEKQLKKRKRNIMNHVQMGMIENAIQDEPNMQRTPASIQLWAEKLSLHGSEVTCSQLKNWLNNRKAKIAREAAKHALVASSGEGDSLTLTDDKQGDHHDDDEKDDVAGSLFRGTETETEAVSVPTHTTSRFKRQPGQHVVMIDEKGEEIGKGCIHLAKGTWFDTNLLDSGLCVVDVNDLKVDETSVLPHPCDATGTSFREAHNILNRKRVLWDSTKLLPTTP